MSSIKSVPVPCGERGTAFVCAAVCRHGGGVVKSNERGAIFALVKSVSLFIGDAVTVRTAKTLGASSVLITSGRESVHKAFQDALYYLKNIGSYHESQNIFKAVIAELPLPVLIFDRHCNLLFHNLSGNYFSLFSMMELFSANIQRLQEKREIKFVCRDGRQLFQITGKRIEYNQETLYAFYIFHAAAEVFGISFFQYETFENYDKELRLLQSYPWPLNLLQFKNVVRQLVADCRSFYISRSTLWRKLSSDQHR